VRMAFRISISAAPLSVAWAHADAFLYSFDLPKSMEKTCGDASGTFGGQRYAR